MTAFRFPVAFVLGLGITGVLFWFLSAMISVSLELVERKSAAKIDFTRLRRDTEVKTIRREKPEPEKPAQSVASVPKIATGVAVEPSAGPIAVGPGVGVTVDVGGILGGPMNVSVGGSDRDEIPLVRIEPDYPPRALSRGIEGWVIIQFTITPAGTTKDVKVVEGQPAGVFDAAAIKAVERWKYNPKVEGGVAMERRGVQVMLTFRLEKG